MYFEFMNKTKVCVGHHALSQLDYECKQYNMKHPLILTDNVLLKLRYVDMITKHLSIPYHLFSDIPVDSSIHTIEEIYSYYQDNHCDGLIALGGGSVLDTAKGVFLMLSQECQSIEEILGFENIKKGKAVPFFAIPTTSGTGSEATCVAVVSHSEKQVKLEIISQHIQSDVAFLDPKLTTNLPIKTTVSTGIDAFVHAIEAYTCSGKNPLSDVYALTAIQLISQNLNKVIDNPHNTTLRNNLALASYLAGGAFSNSMVGIVHAIGHALGAVCHIAHGEAMSMLLVPCMRFNAKSNPHLYDDILLYLDKHTYASSQDLTSDTIQYIHSMLESLHTKTGSPISLETIPNLNQYIDEISEKALNDGALLVNSIHANKKDIQDILGGYYGY